MSCCTRWSRLAEVLGVEGKDLFFFFLCSSCTWHLVVARQDTWAYASMKDFYSAIVLLGFDEFLCAFQQYVFVEAQSLSDAQCCSSFGKIWSFRGCCFPEMIQVGTPHLSIFSAILSPQWECHMPWLRDISIGRNVLCRNAHQLSTLCQVWGAF